MFTPIYLSPVLGSLIATAMASPLRPRDDGDSLARVQIWTPIKSDAVTIYTPEWVWGQGGGFFTKNQFNVIGPEGTSQEGYHQVGVFDFDRVSAKDDPSQFFSVHFTPFEKEYKRLKVSLFVSGVYYVSLTLQCEASLTHNTVVLEYMDFFVTEDVPVASTSKGDIGEIEWSCEWSHGVNPDALVETMKLEYSDD